MTSQTSNGTRVLSEPLTYRRDASVSYFRDLMRSQIESDHFATERLQRHAKEMEFEQRVNPSSNTSTFAPPTWIVEDAATAPRPHRVLAAAVQHFSLPAGHTVNVPRVVTGTTTQAQQDNAPASNTDLTDAAASSTVTTIVGVADVAQNLVDNGGPHTDAVIFQDLQASYDAQLEYQMINGTGVGQNLLGLLNQVPASNQVTYTTGSPTGPLTLLPLGKAMALVGDNRLLAPELWLLRTARWAWLTSSEDTAGQPLQITDWRQAGQGILSVRAALDDAIPVNLGAGTNQDAVLCTRPSDILLFESDLKTIVTPEPLSGTLEVRFSLRGSAAMINRYPSGHSSITGSGMILQAGW